MKLYANGDLAAQRSSQSSLRSNSSHKINIGERDHDYAEILYMESIPTVMTAIKSKAILLINGGSMVNYISLTHTSLNHLPDLLLLKKLTKLIPTGTTLP